MLPATPPHLSSRPGQESLLPAPCLNSPFFFVPHVGTGTLWSQPAKTSPAAIQGHCHIGGGSLHSQARLGDKEEGIQRKSVPLNVMNGSRNQKRGHTSNLPCNEDLSVFGNHSELRAILNTAPALRSQIHAVLHPQDLTQQIPHNQSRFPARCSCER